MSAAEVQPIDEDRVTAVRQRMPSDSGLAYLAEIFSAMGGQTRLKILFALSHAELCVSDLEALLGISVSAVSHQLLLLRGLRLVKFRREGRFTYYSLDDHHVAALLEMGLEHVGDALPAAAAATVTPTAATGALG
jgi:ArsR family transcriptional regulator, lead/cadmium/zinc/bismuth-responsive transcriptional repressor